MNIAPELLYGVGALALLVVLIYAMVQYKHRNRANDPLTEAATREVYDTPTVREYEAKRDDFEDRVRPS